MRTAVRAGLLAALCLALWPALVGAAPPQPKGKLLYEDNFSDKAKSGLEDNLRATDYSRGFHAPGVYHLIMLHDNETNWAIFPKVPALNTFSYQIDIVDNSDDFTGNVSSGVVFRAQDNGHLYAALLDPRKGQYAIRKLSGSSWSDIVAFKPSQLIQPKDGVNTLRVDGEGDTFTIYLNGEQLDTFKDASYKSGGLGMIQSNVDAVKPHTHFDNVKIYTADDVSAGGSQASTGASGAPASLPKTGQPAGDASLALAAGALALLLAGLWVRQRR